MSLPAAPPQRRDFPKVYTLYDIEVKKQAILYAEQHSNKVAQDRYGISEANIRRWRRQRHEIFRTPLNEIVEQRLRTRKPINYKIEKIEKGLETLPPPDPIDSMPLQERLDRSARAPKPPPPAHHLKSHSLSPTKLKVTRHAPKAPPPEPPNEEMCLRWNSHHSNMQTTFPNILLKEQYVDVTLAAEGKTLKCHRLILSSCSPYFDEILSSIHPQQHPVLFMRDIPFCILKSLCDFMYAGEVHVYQNKLEELLTVAEALKIKGLARKSCTEASSQPSKTEAQRKQPEARPPTSYTESHYDHEEMIDPLDLLEPLYEEAAEEFKPVPSHAGKTREVKQYYQPVKKLIPKRLRKRKLSAEPREATPPQVFSLRKGTRSRPNVKIPKYYHTDFSDTSPKVTPPDPLLEFDDIKTEPIDVEDNVIDYSDQESQFLESSANMTILRSPDKFRKIKLSRPVISQVRSVEETELPSGGLEVIKISMAMGGVSDEQPIKDAGAEPAFINAPIIESVCSTAGETPIEDTPTQPIPNDTPLEEQPIEAEEEQPMAEEPSPPFEPITEDYDGNAPITDEPSAVQPITDCYNNGDGPMGDDEILPPIDDCPLEDQPVDNETIENQPLDDQTIDDETIENQPLDDQTIDDTPIGDETIEDQTVEDQQIEDGDDTPLDEEPMAEAPECCDGAEDTPPAELEPIPDELDTPPVLLLGEDTPIEANDDMPPLLHDSMTHMDGDLEMVANNNSPPMNDVVGENYVNEYEERRNTSLDCLEKEAMSVANALSGESQPERDINT